MLQINKIKNSLLYRFHIYLHLKNKLVLTILLQISLILLITSLHDVNYTFCMISDNESDTFSDIQELNSEIIDHNVENIIVHAEADYATSFRDKYTPEEWASLSNEEKTIGPAFECFKKNITSRTLIPEVETFDTKTFEEKLEILRRGYLHESIEKGELTKLASRYHDQAVTRHEALIESQEKIATLSRKNLHLKNQIVELHSLLARRY